MKRRKPELPNIFLNCLYWDKDLKKCTQWNCEEKDMKERCKTCIQYSKPKK